MVIFNFVLSFEGLANVYGWSCVNALSLATKQFDKSWWRSIELKISANARHPRILQVMRRPLAGVTARILRMACALCQVCGYYTFAVRLEDLAVPELPRHHE